VCVCDPTDSQYLELDVDHNGMLSKEELAQYAHGSLTDLVVKRIFEEYHTYDGEMDYKTFLDFILAMENKKEPQALAYFFRLLDIKRVGYLDIFTINCFFREIVSRLSEEDGDVVLVEDVKDEIFDMCAPKDPLRITLEDLINCRVGDTIVTMLTDLSGFWAYDNRETLIQDELAQVCFMCVWVRSTSACLVFGLRRYTITILSEGPISRIDG
jgi:serine/threonine-protein phosphatase 2A regulatory subunit B''